MADVKAAYERPVRCMIAIFDGHLQALCTPIASLLGQLCPLRTSH